MGIPARTLDPLPECPDDAHERVVFAFPYGAARLLAELAELWRLGRTTTFELFLRRALAIDVDQERPRCW